MKLNAITMASILAFSGTLWAEATGTVKSDGEIAKVLTILDEGEVDAAKLELKSGKVAAAKEFAQKMVDEHKANRDQTKSVVKDLKDSDLSKSLKKENEAAYDELKKIEGGKIDRAYIEKQVLMHQAALDLIEKKLIPVVKGPALKSHLEKTRADVAQHLDHAKTLQSQSL